MTPESKFTSVKGLKLHYLDWGDAAYKQTLVCLHGTSGNAHHFDTLARGLVGSYRVIALDQRGHGLSDKPPQGYDAVTLAGDLTALADELGLSAFALLGSSLGSRVATVYTGSYPEKIRHLILVDLSFEMPEAAQQRMIQGHLNRQRTFDSLEAAVVYSRALPQRSRWTSEMHQEDIEHAVFQRPDGKWEWRYSLEAALQSLQQAPQDLWAYARQIRCPILLIRGAESDVLTMRTVEKFRQTVENCRVVEVEGAAHGVARDNPVQFNKVIADFLG